MVCYKNIIYGPTAGDANPNSLTNAVLPTTGKPKLVIEPVYADDGVTLMYYEHTLSIQIILYSQVNNIVNFTDTEAEVDRLKAILSQPGLQLVLYPVGLGTYTAVNHSTGAPDLKGGPYPQELTVEPIASNDAIYLSWKVMFRIARCVVPWNKNVVQFNSELDFDTDDDGDVTFTMRITYQQRTPITNTRELTQIANALIRTPNASFHGMRRRKRISYSRDRRVAKIEVQYKDIKSDNALFPFTRDIECTDEISSSLLPSSESMMGGFQLWERRIAATITLPQRLQKAYAYLVFLNILAERFKGMNVLGGNIKNALQGNIDNNQKADNVRRNWYLLMRVKITNPIYTRTMKFDYGFVLCQDLASIMTRSNILNKVHTSYNPDTLQPRTTSEQWQRWDDSQDKMLNGRFMYEVNILQQVDLCSNQTMSSLSNARVIVASTLVDTETEEPYNTPGTAEKPPRESSYYDYQNNYEIEEENNAVPINYLQPVDESYYKTLNESPTRDSEGVTLHHYQTDPASSLQKNETIVRGLAKHLLKMKGYAIRVGYRIPFPEVKTVNGVAVSRVGTGRYSQKQIGRSANVPVYLAMWDVTYHVNGNIYSNDIFESVVSSGDPGYYS
jgi:hypothetical protein